MRNSLHIKIFIISIFTCSCAPSIYLIDRQTVLEQQASGSWPELDKTFYNEARTINPSELEETKDKKQANTLLPSDN